MITVPKTIYRELCGLCLVGLLAGVLVAGNVVAAEQEPSALEKDSTGWVDVMPGADLKRRRVPD